MPVHVYTDKQARVARAEASVRSVKDLLNDKQAKGGRVEGRESRSGLNEKQSVSCRFSH